MDEIFISYKREERDIAQLFADALKARGWTVWWDPKLRAGEHFDDVIEEIIKNAKCVIVLWSARSTQSRYVKDEASYALDLGKLVPVAIDNSQLPFRFRGLHTIQLQGWKGSVLVPAFQELVKDIEEKLGRPVTRTMENEQPLPELLNERFKSWIGEPSAAGLKDSSESWPESLTKLIPERYARFLRQPQRKSWIGEPSAAGLKDSSEETRENVLRLIEEGNLEEACAKLGIPYITKHDDPIVAEIVAEGDDLLLKSMSQSMDSLPHWQFEELFKRVIRREKDSSSRTGMPVQLIQIAISRGYRELAVRMVHFLISQG
jgi:hypothetical protein